MQLPVFNGFNAVFRLSRHNETRRINRRAFSVGKNLKFFARMRKFFLARFGKIKNYFSIAGKHL